MDRLRIDELIQLLLCVLVRFQVESENVRPMIEKISRVDCTQETRVARGMTIGERHENRVELRGQLVQLIAAAKKRGREGTAAKAAAHTCSTRGN